MEQPSKFEKSLHAAAAWIHDNQEKFWAITGGSFLFILLITLTIHHRETESNEAWLQLGTIQGQLMQGKFDSAQKSLDSWSSRFQGTDAGTYAKFMKADLLYKTSDYAHAAQAYAELAQTGQPELVRPLALSAQASSEEMAGHVPQAIALVQNFLDRYPDHFLAAPRYIQHARLLELTGDRPGAAAIYDRFVLLYPQSPWTSLARSRAQTLGGHAQPTLSTMPVSTPGAKP